MMRRACPRCGRINCTTHPQRQPGQTHWSPGRNRWQQEKFRRAVLDRDGHACVICGSTTDLRACHIIPFAETGSYDPANGRTLCKTHDLETDPYAR